MGQYWHSFNLDKWERGGLEGGKLGEVLWGAHLDSFFVKRLAIPLEYEKFLGEYLAELMPRPSLLTPETEHYLGRLALPPEILLHILDEVGDVQAAASLGLTNTRLLHIGIKRIRALMVKQVAHWAGDRIVCMGDYQDDRDLPDDMLTEKEKKEARLFRPPNARQPVSEWDHRPLHAPDSYALPLRKGETAPGNEDLHNIYGLADLFYHVDGDDDGNWSDGEHDFQSKLSGDELKIYRLLTQGFCKVKGQEGEQWVLCNLTKREYIRHDAVVGLSKQSKASGPYTDGPMGLGHVLLTRICWSSDPSVAMPRGEGLHRGSWAGNRFEITTVERMRPGEWTDITNEAVSAAGDVWDGGFGERWREPVPKKSARSRFH